MEVTTSTHTLRRIDAAPGHLLIERAALDAARTRAKSDPSLVPLDPSLAPYTSPTVYLGVGDTPDRYTEITEAEAAQIAAAYAAKANGAADSSVAYEACNETTSN